MNVQEKSREIQSRSFVRKLVVAGFAISLLSSLVLAGTAGASYNIGTGIGDLGGALGNSSGSSGGNSDTYGFAPELCVALEPALESVAPGNPFFDWFAAFALQAGCAAYVDTGSSPSLLDLEFIRGAYTGDAITIGSVNTVGSAPLLDIAMTSFGTIYGIDGTYLYTINPFTAQATVVGPLGVAAGANGLVVSPDGFLFASGGDDLYVLNPFTGEGFWIGATGFDSSGDLAFAQDGQLYMTALCGPCDDVLVALNPFTGAGTLVGSTDDIDVGGLVSSYGTLFGATALGDLLVIDQFGGGGTVIATGGPSAYGMASPPDAT